MSAILRASSNPDWALADLTYQVRTRIQVRLGGWLGDSPRSTRRFDRLSRRPSIRASVLCVHRWQCPDIYASSTACWQTLVGQKLKNENSHVVPPMHLES